MYNIGDIVLVTHIPYNRWIDKSMLTGPSIITDYKLGWDDENCYNLKFLNSSLSQTVPIYCVISLNNSLLKLIFDV